MFKRFEANDYIETLSSQRKLLGIRLKEMKILFLLLPGVRNCAGMKLYAWTLDVTSPASVANAGNLLKAGIDLFTTNTPHKLAGLLNP